MRVYVTISFVRSGDDTRLSLCGDEVWFSLQCAFVLFTQVNHLGFLSTEIFLFRETRENHIRPTIPSASFFSSLSLTRAAGRWSFNVVLFGPT